MARWLIVREGRGNDAVQVFYDNLVTGMRYKLGRLSSDVPDNMILDWIFNHGEPTPGDRIMLSDGSSLMFTSPREAACA